MGVRIATRPCQTTRLPKSRNHEIPQSPRPESRTYTVTSFLTRQRRACRILVLMTLCTMVNADRAAFEKELEKVFGPSKGYGKKYMSTRWKHTENGPYIPVTIMPEGFTRDVNPYPGKHDGHIHKRMATDDNDDYYTDGLDKHKAGCFWAGKYRLAINVSSDPSFDVIRAVWFHSAKDLQKQFSGSSLRRRLGKSEFSPQFVRLCQEIMDA